MMNKFMRVDDELVSLVKEYITVLENKRGGRYSQASAVKIALRKVLNK